MKNTKRILVTGAGGAPAWNFIRSLRDAPEEFHIIGTDCDPLYAQRAKAVVDEFYAVPKALDDPPAYVERLKKVISLSEAEFLHCQNDAEMSVISAYREHLLTHTMLFLPRPLSVTRCHNKLESNRLWSAEGITVPRMFRIDTPEYLDIALGVLGGKAWLRPYQLTAGGYQSIGASSYAQAASWIERCKGWGRFAAADWLTPRSVTWQSIWNRGRLIVAQGRERLTWEGGRASPSGVSGSTGTGMTISDSVLDKLAVRCIQSIDPSPNGVWGVDFTYDENGVPNPTEINIGRFFTTHYFFTRCGCNMPYVLVKLAYGETVTPMPISPIREGMLWIRGMDVEPVLSSLDEARLDWLRAGDMNEVLPNV